MGDTTPRNDHDLLIEINATVKSIEGWVKSINGRVTQNSKDIVLLRLRDAYWAGGVAALVGIAGAVRWLLSG